MYINVYVLKDIATIWSYATLDKRIVQTGHAEVHIETPLMYKSNPPTINPI